MTYSTQDFISPSDALAHFGVKGMKWGIRNEDKPAGDADIKSLPATPNETAAKRVYQSLPNPPASDKTVRARVLQQPKQLADKFTADPSEGGLTPEQKKKIAYGVAGTLAAAAIIGGAYYYKKQGGQLSFEGLDNFQKNMRESQLNSARNNFLTKESFDRPAFSLPAGHTFYRMSSGPESGFRAATYASPSIDDFRRYASALPDSLSHKITFKTTSELKVPSLTTNLETLREVLGRQTKSVVSHEEALNRYRSMIGNSWSDETSQSFFSALKAKGFGAIVDDMDHGIISERPLIIFANEQFGPKKSTRLSYKELMKLRSEVTDFANRK